MNILNFAFILFIIFKLYSCYIVYPLKTYEDSTKIENLLLFNSTYTTLQMGTPPQKVNFEFSLNHSKMFITDVNCKNTNLYNLMESSTLFMLGETDDDDPYNSLIIAMESFYFYENINLTIMNEINAFPLYYSVDLRNEQTYLCGNIGLSIMQYESLDEEPDEIEYYLKFLRSQNNYFSFFNYKGEDYIVNSIFLHEEFIDIFHDVNNISWVNPIMRNNYLHWEISMKEIYYNKVHIKDKIIFELNPLFELIVGNNDYKINIQKDFFDSYINKDICSINNIENYQTFECDSNKFSIREIQKFPNLYMYNIDIDYIFNLTSEELFIQLNNIYYFKIIFPSENLDLNNRWIMGRTFLRKYPTIFSPSNRLVGFYVNQKESEITWKEEENNEEDKVDGKKNDISKKISFYIIILVMIALIFTCFGLFIGRRIFFSRKKKVNELIDDYYQYNKEKKDKNKKEEKINENTFTSIEMNSKIGNNQ